MADIGVVRTRQQILTVSKAEPQVAKPADASTRRNTARVATSPRKDPPRKFPKGWNAAWFEACARSGILPEELLEKPKEAFWSAGASERTIAMRQAHYEERRLDRLATVKAAYNEADGGMTERSSSSLQLGDGQSPEDRRKAAMVRRMEEMKQEAQQAAALDTEKKKARQAKELEAAMKAEEKRQEDLRAMEHKRELQRQKEIMQQQVRVHECNVIDRLR